MTGKYVVIDYKDFTHSVEVESLAFALHIWPSSNTCKLHITVQPPISVMLAPSPSIYVILDNLKLKLGVLVDALIGADACVLVVNPDPVQIVKLMEAVL